MPRAKSRSRRKSGATKVAGAASKKAGKVDVAAAAVAVAGKVGRRKSTEAVAYVEGLVRADSSPSLADLRGVKEYFQLLIGVCMALALGPLVGVVVGMAMLWEAIDRGFAGGFVQSGKELSGFLCARAMPWITRTTTGFNKRFVKRAEDAFMVNCAIGYGVLVPAFFCFCFWHQMNNGFNVGLFLLYHVCRIGPYFMNFAYVYTLCHKEGHSRIGLWRGCYNNFVMKNWFNWWVGLFYGVIPSSFAYGHSINHHRYNNGPKDVVTTSDKPRDNWICFLCYLPRWIMYAGNVSTIIQFVKEGNAKITRHMVYGSIWYYSWVGYWAYHYPVFAACYVFFPFFENVMLLACVNWSWHSFMNPLDPEDEYVQSITILDGPINVLNEDFHVVHHQYPGGHWTAHPGYLKKHWDSYYDRQGSVFKGTHAFEIFAMLLVRDWDALAERFQDLKGRRAGQEMSHEEKIAVLKSRARACWWGPRAPVELLELEGRNVGNLMDGKGDSFAHENAAGEAKRRSQRK